MSKALKKIFEDEKIINFIRFKEYCLFNCKKNYQETIKMYYQLEAKRNLAHFSKKYVIKFSFNFNRLAYMLEMGRFCNTYLVIKFLQNNFHHKQYMPPSSKTNVLYFVRQKVHSLSQILRRYIGKLPSVYFHFHIRKEDKVT